MGKKLSVAKQLNPPTDFSIVEEYIEDQAPRKIHDAFNRIKTVFQNNKMAVNEPPTQPTMKLPSPNEVWNYLESLPVPSTHILLSGDHVKYYVRMAYEFIAQQLHINIKTL